MKIDNETVKNAIQKLLNFTKMLHSTDETIQRAFISNFHDFEDALINSLAENLNMDAIITNNIVDFTRSNLPIYRPVDFISLYE